MPNILHIFNQFLPTTENWILNTIRNARGIRHFISAYHFLENRCIEKDFEYAIDAEDKTRELYVSSSTKGVKRIVERLWIKSYHLYKGTTQCRLVRYCKSHNIEILHAHFANIGWEFLSVARKTGLPYFVSFYGWDYEKLSFINPKYDKRIQVLFKEATGIICEGNHGKEILKKKGCKSDKIFIQKLGIDVENIVFRKGSNEKKKIRLVQVASITPKKGHIYAIRALAQVVERNKNVALTFIGNESESGLKAKLEEEVRILKLQNHVSFVNQIEYENLHKTLSEYDVFIHPSCYAEDKDCEGGAPIVLLDAQAVGLPIISTFHCDIPEEVVDGHTGILCPEKDENSLAEAILHFKQMDNKRFSEFSLNARKHVEDNYDIRKTAPRLTDIYKQALL